MVFYIYFTLLLLLIIIIITKFLPRVSLLLISAEMFMQCIDLKHEDMVEVQKEEGLEVEEQNKKKRRSKKWMRKRKKEEVEY